MSVWFLFHQIKKNKKNKKIYIYIDQSSVRKKSYEEWKGTDKSHGKEHREGEIEVEDRKH